jgi:hypothetical protein
MKLFTHIANFFKPTKPKMTLFGGVLGLWLLVNILDLACGLWLPNHGYGWVITFAPSTLCSYGVKKMLMSHIYTYIPLLSSLSGSSVSQWIFGLIPYVFRFFVYYCIIFVLTTIHSCLRKKYVKKLVDGIAYVLLTLVLISVIVVFVKARNPLDNPVYGPISGGSVCDGDYYEPYNLGNIQYGKCVLFFRNYTLEQRQELSSRHYYTDEDCHTFARESGYERWIEYNMLRCLCQNQPEIVIDYTSSLFQDEVVNQGKESLCQASRLDWSLYPRKKKELRK